MAKFRAATTDGVARQYLVILSPEKLKKRHRGFSSRDVPKQAQALRSEYGIDVLQWWHRAAPIVLIEADPAIARALSEDSRVDLVEQNREVEIDRPSSEKRGSGQGPSKQVCAAPSSPQSIQGCPDPTSSSCTDNWGLDRIVAQPGQPLDGQYSWNRTGFGVHVFAFDLGIRADHCELGGRVESGIPGGPESEHGTRVASIIGGSSIGVAKQARIHDIPVVALDTSEDLTTRKVLNGFEEILATMEDRNIGPAVINASWNIPKLLSDPQWVFPGVSELPLVPGAISRVARAIVEDWGIPLVVSAGNRNTTPLDFTPSDLGYVEGVIVVGGVNIEDQRWVVDPSEPRCMGDADNVGGDCGSNFGPGVDLWAPAEGIYSAEAGPAVASTNSGTSFAAPHVTGVVALILQDDPNRSPKDIERLLELRALPEVTSSIGNAPNLLLQVPTFQSSTNRAPVARNDSARTTVDSPISLDVLFNDLDREDSALSLVGLSQPSNGAAALSGNQVIYTPNDDFFGSDTFGYTVSDGSLTATATVTVGVERDLPPTAIPDHRVLALASGQSTGVDLYPERLLIVNDVDAEGLNQFLAHGPLVDEAGNACTGCSVQRVQASFGWDYRVEVPATPVQTYSFDLTIRDSYSGNDGLDHTDTAKVYISTFLPGTNSLPIAEMDEAYSEPDVPITLDLLANDTDDGGPLDLVAITPPRRGSASISSATSVTYQPPPGFEGWDGFTYLVEDIDGNLGAASVRVQIGGNNPPRAVDCGFSTDVGQAISRNLSQLIDECPEISDPEDDSLIFSACGQPTQGSVACTASAFHFVPPAGFEGDSVFSYTLGDGKGGLDSATITIRIGEPSGDFDDGDDDHPLGTSDHFQVPFGSTSHLIQNGLLLSNDTGPGTLRVCGYLDTAVHGSLDTTPLIGVEYEPAATFWSAGTDTFYYRLSNRSDCSRVFPVKVTVTAGPDPGCGPPASGTWTVTEDCVFQGTATAPANVVVQNGATLEITSGSVLDIAFNQHYLLVRDGSRVIIQAGARID